MIEETRTRFIFAMITSLAIASCASDGLGNNQFRSNAVIDSEQYDLATSVKADTKPVLLRGNAPKYPVGKLINGQEGCAFISFAIGVDGKTKDFKVIKTDDEWFARHAILAVSDWTYTPATKQGSPIEVRLKHKFCFKTN